MSERDQNPIRV
ncbi:hypothetical protein JL09_g6759 [Pichia kudriavzevii]|uniref:Uncharacterized protein n=1 Tax=Pichia kudriavzevii TaxID=4909 RepID=A0A099NKJ3_PICKU|nr:hypothetical protein JL09_g6759 [Pichia kudriavzevii]